MKKNPLEHLLEELSASENYDYDEKSLNRLNYELEIASKNGDMEAVKSSIASGASVNSKRQNGVTPLMHAAASGHLDCVKYLIGNGANIDAIDDHGSSALTHACINGQPECGRALLESGATTRNTEQHSDMMSALANGNIACAEMLLDYGCEILSCVKDKYPSRYKELRSYEKNLKPHPDGDRTSPRGGNDQLGI